MSEQRNEDGLTEAEFLASYDPGRYPRPSNTVDLVLMTVSEGALKLLLIRRRNHPWIGQWALPGGFVEISEDMDDAAERELREETSITRHTYFRQLYTFGNADRDPRTRVISTAYLSLTPASNLKAAKAGDDASDTAWVTVSKTLKHADDRERVSILHLDDEEHGIAMSYEIHDKAMHNYIETRSRLLKCSSTQLAADHVKAINMAMDQVQHRAAATGILFNLLPEEATLREIQTAYEAVQGRKVDTGNFRRDIRKMLLSTGHTRKSGGRTAAVYRFNPMFRYLEENL